MYVNHTIYRFLYFFYFLCLDHREESDKCNRRRSEVNAQDDYDNDCEHHDDENYDDEQDNNQNDPYALLVIPFFGIIGGIMVYVIRRFKDRLLIIILDTILNCTGGRERVETSTSETDSTSADTTYVKERLQVPQVTSETSSSIFPLSSFSADTWDDRIVTGAKKIFDHWMEERKNVTEVSTQVSDSDIEMQIEMKDISIMRSSDEVHRSDHEVETAETSFIQTRSGRTYKKIFV